MLPIWQTDEIIKSLSDEVRIIGRKKYDKDFKLQLVNEHNENGFSYWKLSKIYGVKPSIIRRWGHIYDVDTYSITNPPKRSKS